MLGLPLCRHAHSLFGACFRSRARDAVASPARSPPHHLPTSLTARLPAAVSGAVFAVARADRRPQRGQPVLHTGIHLQLLRRVLLWPLVSLAERGGAACMPALRAPPDRCLLRYACSRWDLLRSRCRQCGAPKHPLCSAAGLCAAHLPLVEQNRWARPRACELLLFCTGGRGQGRRWAAGSVAVALRGQPRPADRCPLPAPLSPASPPACSGRLATRAGAS